MAKRRTRATLSLAAMALAGSGCVGRIEDWKAFRDCTQERCAEGGAYSERSAQQRGGGGASALGSSSAFVGQVAFGGNSASGGQSALGGTSASGGQSALGGNSASGGQSALGGNSASGGQSALGGGASVASSTIVMEPRPVDHRNTLAVGRLFTCAIRNEKLGCWGVNNLKQLGSEVGWPAGSTIPVDVDLSGVPGDKFTPVEVTAGSYHACARSSKGTVVCWGNGLSSGSTEPFTSPIRVNLSESTIGEPLELSAKGSHSCAKLRTWGDVWCWGRNSDINSSGASEPGDSSQDSLTPVQVDLAWQENGAVQIAAGESHACALRKDKSVWCWGNNDRYQLGHTLRADPTALEPVEFSSRADQIIQVSSGFNHVCARDNLGKVFCWGDNSYGQIDAQSGAATSYVAPYLISLAAPASDVSAGLRHSCALLNDGSVWCWGSDYENRGLLGAAVGSPSGPVKVEFAGNPKIVELAVGVTHSCARREDGGVHCWGWAGSDQTVSALGGTSLEIAKQLP